MQARKSEIDLVWKPSASPSCGPVARALWGQGAKLEELEVGVQFAGILVAFLGEDAYVLRRAVAPLDPAAALEVYAVDAGEGFVAVRTLGDPFNLPYQSRHRGERKGALGHKDAGAIRVDAAGETNTRPAPEKSRLTLLDSASPDRASRA